MKDTSGSISTGVGCNRSRLAFETDDDDVDMYIYDDPDYNAEDIFIAGGYRI